MLSTFVRIARTIVAIASSVVVIVLSGTVVLLLAPVCVAAYPLLAVLGLPNPLILIAWPWAGAITWVHRVMLRVRFRAEVELSGILPRRPIILVCNHPPAALFPLMVWFVRYVSLFPIAVAKAGVLVNPLMGPFVAGPAMLMRAVVVTTRGNGWGAKLIERSTRWTVTRYSALIIFADQHRPGSPKAAVDYERMRGRVPSIEWHQRLGAYHVLGIFTALKTLGPTAQVVAMDLSFPRKAVGWLAPWYIWNATIAVRLRDVTDRFQGAMGESDEKGKPPAPFMEATNDLATEADNFIARHNP